MSNWVPTSIRLPIIRSADDTHRHTKQKPQQHFSWTGYSRAGQATSFVIPEFKWIFDAGLRLVEWRPHVVFISHTHADHIHALPSILLSGRPKSSTPWPTIHVYVPAASLQDLRAFLYAYYQLIRDYDDENDDDDDDDTDATTSPNVNNAVDAVDIEQLYSFRLIPVSFNEEIILPAHTSSSGNKCRYVVQTVECDHLKSCVGYSIFAQHSVRKLEYRDLDGAALGALARSKTSQLNEWGPLEPFFCFLGDTTPLVFDRYPQLLQHHSYIAVECTYYQEHSNGTATLTPTTKMSTKMDDVARAATNKHMHWKDLKSVIVPRSTDKRHDVLFLLQHFSLKHTTSQWCAWLYQFNADCTLYNVHPMIAPNTTAANDALELRCNCFVCDPSHCVRQLSLEEREKCNG
jgi:ribonuclease BN (tRNA processing enzyme)